MSKNSVMLRWIATDRLSPGQCERLDALLAPEERDRAARFRHRTDRLAFTAAHALARAMLHRATGRAPLTWRFRMGDHGKPQPVTHAGEPLLCLNLSHTRDLAVVAVGVNHELGVDAEWLGRPAPLDIAERFFAPREMERLRASPEASRHEIFYALWTLKEAYAKGTARGMSLPLDSFAFDLEPPRLLYSVEDPDCGRWRFHQQPIGTNHIVALAVDWPQDALPQLLLAPFDVECMAAPAGTG